MSFGTIYPNLSKFGFQKRDLLLLFLSVTTFLLIFQLLSASANAEAVANNTINTTPAVAPLNNITLNFSVYSNNTGTASILNLTNVTFVFQPLTVGSQQFNLTNTSPANVNTSANFVVTTPNSTTIRFSNTSTSSDLFTANAQQLSFSFAVAAPLSGAYVIFVNTTYNSTLLGNSTTVTLNVANGTVTLTNASFSNITYTGTGTSLQMNFTSSFSAPTGGGTINSNVSTNLYVNGALTATNYTNTTAGTFINSTINNTQFAANNYTFVFNTTGALPSGLGNYSSSSLTTVLQISKGTLVLSLTASNVTYPTSIVANTTPINNTGALDVNYTLYSNATTGNLTAGGLVNFSSTLGNGNISQTILAGFGIYTYTLNTTSATFANWTANTTGISTTINVSQGTPNVTVNINGTVANNTVNYPVSILNVTGATNSSGVLPNFYLYTNSTAGNAINLTSGSANSTSTFRFPAGTWQMFYNTSGNANWTSTTNTTIYAIINSGIQGITIYINGSTNGTYPIEKNVSSIVNITAVSNATIDNVTSSFNIYVNYTGVNLSASSTSGPVINNLYNTTNTSNLNVGNQTIIANISSTANYSSATNTTAFILWVQDNTPPSITSFTLTRATTIYVGSTLSSGDFACPYTDNDWQSTDTTTISGLSTTEPGTKTATCSVKDPSGNSASRTTSYTVYSLSSPSSATSTSASGSVAATTGTVKATALILQVAAGGIATVNIDKSLATSVNQITIGVNNLASNVAVNVAKLTDKPSDVSASPTGTTLNYINITVDNLPTYYVTNATIQFFVPKAWIQQNNIDANTISLNRYVNGQWNNLGSIRVSDDADSVYYQSATPGFSLFSITGQQAAVTAPPTQTNQTANQTPTQPPVVTPSGNVNPLIIGVVIVIILLAAGYFYYQQNKKPWDNLKGKYK